MKRLALLLLLGGCLASEKDIGPSAHVQLSSGFSSASDEDEQPSLSPDDTSHDFPIAIELDVEPGSKTVKGSTSDESFPVTQLTATIGDTTLSFSDFTQSDVSDFSQTLMSSSPVTLPSSAAGSTLHVSFDLEDSRGLHANTLAFDVELDAN
jgi:hypothetical protein